VKKSTSQKKIEPVLVFTTGTFILVPDVTKLTRKIQKQEKQRKQRRQRNKGDKSLSIVSYTILLQKLIVRIDKIV
jgi:hypothetical protein